jgi:hypothetical protein
LGGTAASGYQTTAGLAANVAALTSNNATNLGGASAASYQTTAGLSANVAALTSNNATNLGGLSAASYANLSVATFTTSVNVGANVQLSTLTVTANAAAIGPGFIANSTGAYHTGLINAASHTATGYVANTTGVYHTGTVNAASHTTTGFTANTTGVYPTSNSSGQALGLSTARYILYANSVDVTGTAALGNTTVTGFVNASVSVNSALVAVGTAFVANTTGAYHTGTINAASHTVGAAVVANTTGFFTAAGVYVNTIAIKAPNTGLVTATSAAANGYTYLTGGMLMQWGWVSAANTGAVATFAIAFPTAALICTASAVNTTATQGNCTISVKTINTTAVTIQTGNTTATNCHYIVIGN